MTLYIFSGILMIYILLSILILPFQYRYIKAIKAEENKLKSNGKKQSDMYDKMNPGELVLHENVQGNGLFFLANILASIVYRIKHSK
ncbi:DUF3949 domain-containing protein [Heyndrickxia sp. MSNUG]|uniref:DUF3949 domain-containing protein n=1 Tax=Heyndrickxia sp. MSNUG TaxID=3136677 RepID=UPI003C2E9410